ncbi:MAG: Na+:solute symporter [Bacteroidetes bacterium]|nr:Na+:solute symporter [Bacteroidota bacterium]
MIALSNLDYIIIVLFFSITLFIGLSVSKKSGSDATQFFLSGRNMPWWLLGLSMVATTFSTDTPNLVTDIVRKDGVAGNWVWWAFLLTGMLTVFVYAKLWRRSNVSTDLEFYELRYGGAPAKFLRRFRAVYLGIAFNILAMSGVTLAAIKIGQIMLGLQPLETVLYAGVVTVIFSAVGGFKGVVYTDFLLFFVAMAGSIGAAWYCVNLPEVGGLDALMQHNNVADKLALLPDFSEKEALITLLVIPLAVQWWSSWYPGAEPGGGGYIAQRMLAAKDENHAIGATFFFNIMHYALRPWPWILVALASLVVFPDIQSIQTAFPDISADKLGHDLAYSAMLTKLPAGLIGLVLASLVAAYMSTISTHLNWGSSYIVNDLYKQQINPEASEKKLVAVGRISTVVLMVVSALVALSLQNAKQLFDIIIMFGAGTGLIFILRWFWWRINAWSEISAMIISGVVSLIFSFTDFGKSLFDHTDIETGTTVPGVFEDWAKFPLVVLITTVVWLFTTFFTKAEDENVLRNFYIKIKPGGPGWAKVVKKAASEGMQINKGETGWSVPSGILAMLVGCAMVYSALFTTGNLIYGNTTEASIAFVLTIVFAIALKKVWAKVRTKVL